MAVTSRSGQTPPDAGDGSDLGRVLIESPEGVKGGRVFDAFDVTPEAVALYGALLRAPTADPAQLSAMLAMSADQVRRALDELLGIELISRPGSDEGRFVIRAPDDAVEHLIDRERVRLDTHLRRVEEQRSQVGELVRTFVESHLITDESERVEHIANPHAVRSRLYELAERATESGATMVPGEAYDPKATAAALRLDMAMLKRGLSLRMIVTEVSLVEEYWADYLATITAARARVRIHPAPPMLMVILDRTTSVIPAPGDSSGALILHGAALSQPSITLFDEVWALSTPLADVPAEAMLGPDKISETRARQVVNLLAQGMTDETIARRLGVSVRTVRRLITTASSLLGASSRFQAGVLAAQRGWVGPVHGYLRSSDHRVFPVGPADRPRSD